MNLLVKKKTKKITTPRELSNNSFEPTKPQPSRSRGRVSLARRLCRASGQRRGSGRHKHGCTLPGCPRPLWLRTQVWTSHTEDRRPEEVWGLHRLQSGRPFLPLRTTGLVDITQIQDCLSSLPSHVRGHPETFSLSFSLVT